MPPVIIAFSVLTSHQYTNSKLFAPVATRIKKILTQEDGEKSVTKHYQPYSISAYNSANLMQVIIVGLGRAMVRKFDPSITG